MSCRNRLFFCALIILNVIIGFNTRVLAQPDKAFDEIPLNGLAALTQLRQEYYIAGLYLESLSQDSGDVFNFSGRKRMELRITIDKWSPRRFGQQWNQAILINNDQQELEQFADQILAFTSLPQDDLLAGDRITIDMAPNIGTTVYINNQRMFQVKDNTFFDLLLNTWIGQRPPSSDFKNDILTLPTDQAGTELLVRYEATTFEPNRAKKVANWKVDLKDQSPQSATGGAVAVDVAPPGSGTTVTAKRAHAETTTTTGDIAAPVMDVAIEAPAPMLGLEQPKLSTTIEQPKLPTAKQTKAVSKPEPKPQTKATPEKTAVAPVTDNAEQEKLTSAYRANALKLTFLNTQYPKRALRFNQEGVVALKVTIGRNGEVKKITEESSSEHELLNKAAYKAIEKTAPYPEFPKELKSDSLEVTFPFNFRL